MKKYRKLIFIVAAAIIIVGGAFTAKYFSDLPTYRQAIEAITIGDVDLSQIPDDTYTGSEDTIWVGATVEVTVNNHRITEIKLDQRHGQGIDAEIIPDQVIEAQSLQIDVVSGSTSSSKVILKAIEKALLSSLE